MKLSDEVKEVISRFDAKYPVPVTDNVEDSQNWTHRLAEQLKYSFPSDGWGHKFAGLGRPHSSDVVCLSSPFMGWDIIYNSGSPSAELNLNAESIDLSGQIFEQVTAYDHLGNDGGTIPPPPSGGTIEEKLDRIISLLTTYHNEEMDAITAPRITKIS